MKDQQFSFARLPDLITPRHLIEAGYPGGKNAVYNLFAQEDFPAIYNAKHRKKLVSKVALMRYCKAQ